VTQLGRGAEQGALQSTGEPYDMAIQGDGYFQVRRADGQIALTRSGSFIVDARRQLVNPNGERLVPPLTIPRGIDPARVTIAADGTVSASGRRIGQIQLVTVPAPNGLAPAGNNDYLVTAASGGVRRATGTLVQGVLETSNVDLADAMVDMMDSQRSYQMASKAIQMQDKMMEIANQLKQ
jgi:flagellar basal-body rod protein FlgG